MGLSEGARSCADPQAVSTHRSRQAGGHSPVPGLQSGTQAKRPTTLVKPLRLRSPSTAASSTPGPEYKHRRGEAKPCRGCSWWEVGAENAAQDESPDGRAEETDTQADAGGGVRAIWLWAPGQSEAWTLELLQDDLALPGRG